MKLNQQVTTLKGIGPKRAAALANKHIVTIKDLLFLFPRQYEDKSVFYSPHVLTEGKVTITVTIHSKGFSYFPRRNFSIVGYQAWCQELDGSIKISWYNQPYMLKNVRSGEEYYCYGKLFKDKGSYTMVNPKCVLKSDPGNFFELTPIYPKIEGVPHSLIQKTIADFLKEPFENSVLDPPSWLMAELQLPRFFEALQGIHCPKNQKEIEKGYIRIKVEEALKIHLGIMHFKQDFKQSDFELSRWEKIEQFVRSLPFTLTEGQSAALDDIVLDLKSGKVMNRLIQGDVGSGKTVLAVIACFFMAINGYQSAYMAPTDILARQHHATFKKFLEPFGIQVGLLTGTLNSEEERITKEKMRTGEVSVVIGTHALIQETTDFYHLAFVVTDEQHRFGVKQRAKLATKGAGPPHVLIMSATPIPRTLALILYGDLHVSEIKEKPKGRKPVKTFFYREKYWPKVLGFLTEQVAHGNQAFVVCPFIEESEGMEKVRDVQNVYEEVREKIGQNCRIGLLHGQMKNDEKNKVIDGFTKKEIDILVATTIIEVGIDVQNANVMVILSPERFGLAQLHQLRGRVGRGKAQAYCILLSDTQNEDTLKRMEMLVTARDGFEIAERDFELRGSGDYFGTRQHGLPRFFALDPLKDLEIIEKTKKIAEALYQSGKKEDMIYKDRMIADFEVETEEITLT